MESAASLNSIPRHATKHYREEMTSSFWTKASQSTSGSLTASNGDGVAASQYVIPHLRTNRNYRERMRSEVYQIDSTYQNPSDPNSMMDQGPVRNSHYVIETNNHRRASSSKADKLSKTQAWKGYPASVNERPTSAYASGNIM
jgi:hypothetical protein